MSINLHLNLFWNNIYRNLISLTYFSIDLVVCALLLYIFSSCLVMFALVSFVVGAFGNLRWLMRWLKCINIYASSNY